MKVRPMKYSSSLFAGLLVAVFLVGLFFPFAAEAGQNSGTWSCAGTGLNKIFCGITSQFRFMPKLLALFSYVIAIGLAVSGLLQLKQYGDDPSKVPLRGIIIKLALSAMLISLPFSMQIFVTTVTGSNSIQQGNTSIAKPKLGTGVSGM